MCAHEQASVKATASERAEAISSMASYRPGERSPESACGVRRKHRWKECEKVPRVTRSLAGAWVCEVCVNACVCASAAAHEQASEGDAVRACKVHL